MKRLFSLLLALGIMLTSFPVNSYAAEEQERDELINLACTVFPEFSEKILNPTIINQPYSRSIEEPVLVYSEARAISENEELIYSEYSNGAVLLTSYNKELTRTSYESNSFAVHITANIKATCTSSSGYFQLTGIKYSFLANDYDLITNTGTASKSGRCTAYSLYNSKLQENASGSAQLSYTLTFQLGSTGAQSVLTRLTLYVGSDSESVSHYAIS